MMLSEGKGGFIDYGKYRSRLTDIVWLGIMPELTAEERVEAAKTPTGEAPPQSAMDEARALYEASRQRLAVKEN